MLKLDENFYLTNDNSNWILNREVKGEIIAKGNQKISKDVWYCGTLKACLNRYVNETTKVAGSVSDLIVILDNTYSLIKNLKV